MINKLFQTKKPFIGFITAGDGGINYCVDCCFELIAGGVDAIEIGLPFSDPIADGVVIQQSSNRALAAGITPDAVLEIARRIRLESAVPLILFSYYNPILQQGESYLKKVTLAGFNGMLIVDLSPSQYQTDDSYYEAIKSVGISPILLAAPSSSDERLKMIARHAEGFIYYACQKGTTGVKNDLPSDFELQINRVKKASTLPVVVGFGISDNISARRALSCADGFVVGSAFVNLMAKKADPSELRNFARQIDPRTT